ncbi:GyrI-like domain-containing protein [Sporosarcina thermotolerans]|uniref:GyrI-like domain-containing protein n=1 Tax=Sporosarcina thermotolerans TaxID=633404 RepID=A0AAW9AAZ2_9BACL|nr:GyrI-like domain-containing protein [Sporosarcina thermotolerans]MDW0116818.1 GyrI-like domain-containing protein [Sporosarcina thermotolerans]WHT48993.1 GyrI-like domain-containing protein [Sporosarcina thermotolerans]
MGTRIELVEQFTVKGYEMHGPVTQIPKLWDELNGVIQEKGASPEESFGITLEMDKGNFHYLAGIRSEFAEGFSDTKEFFIPSGKFIVAKVEGGVEAIPAAFDALLRNPDVKLRHSYGFERYIHPTGSEGYEIEVWVAIE